MARATAVPAGVLWVCSCCLFAREGDGCQDHEPEHTPWQREPDTDVTIGLTRELHAPDCPTRTGDDDAFPCECDVITFTWSRCDGCGSPLAGERHAYTYWQ